MTDNAMIRLEELTKRYPGQGRPAVTDLSMDIEEGEIVVLVGPSGCGKTTTMKLVNRIIEPTSGRIFLEGEDVTTVNADGLRRRIGYAIQQVGLFPHMTIAENIATVPKMLGWDRKRIADRVDELLGLVRLDPELYRNRYPKQLSGGQQQRVGVARALGADPPVMLMDEPFGAIDPLTRESLQNEFLQVQADIKKTIVFVTHDIDEAIRMGDRIAIFREGGHLEQFDTPTAILAEPANDFVTDFLGAERGLKRLALIPVSDVKADPGPVVRPGDPRDRAHQVTATGGTDWVVVVDADGRLCGWAYVDELGEQVEVTDARPFSLRVFADDSLRKALDSMVTSRTGVAVRVSGDDRYEGMLTQDILTREIV